MKIDPKNNHPIIKGEGIERIPSSTKKKDLSSIPDSFDSVLDNAISANEKKAKVSAEFIAADHSPPIGDIMQTGMLRKNSINKIEKLLPSMEMFKNALANPGIDLPIMEELLLEMVITSEEAIEYLPHLSEKDPLREIISDAAVTVLTESQNYYNRYIS